MTTRIFTGNSDQPRILTLVRHNTHPNPYFADILLNLTSRIRVDQQPYWCNAKGYGYGMPPTYPVDDTIGGPDEADHIAMRLRFYTPQEAFEFKLKNG